VQITSKVDERAEIQDKTKLLKFVGQNTGEEKTTHIRKHGNLHINTAC
jgi:hypothetical protein